MKRKKVFLIGLTTFTLSVGAIALLAANPELGLLRTLGTNDEVWNHYSGVDATLESKGIKEYWVSCSSHTHQFTAPSTGTIVDQGAPSQSFIDSLSDNDDRLIGRYLRGFDFDDGANPYITIKSGFDSLEVVNGEGIRGSKALRATRSTNGDSFLKISKAYLDKIFADPNVKALSFAAKAHNPTNNFRHITVDASYVNNNSDIISCFEINNSNWGITTEYKTFYFTRGVYSQMNMDNTNLDWFVKFGAGSVLPQYLYLDDFRICGNDYYDYTVTSLDNGYWDPTNMQLKDPVLNQRMFSVSGQVENVGFDYSSFTDGARSFRFDKKNGYSAYYISMNIVNQMSSDDYLTFDMYGTTALHCSNGAIFSGMNHQFLEQNFPAGKWVTLKMLKSEITTDGRFLVLQGSATGTYYLDNFRINSTKQSFEHHPFISTFGDYTNITHYYIADATASSTLRDSTQDQIFLTEWGFVKGIELTTEKATDGAYSLKFTCSGSGPMRISAQWFKFLMFDTSTISFDIYSENMNFSGIFAGVTRGQWCKVTVTKADCASFNNNGRICTSGTSSGVMYIDNLTVTI